MNSQTKNNRPNGKPNLYRRNVDQDNISTILSSGSLYLIRNKMEDNNYEIENMLLEQMTIVLNPLVLNSNDRFRLLMYQISQIREVLSIPQTEMPPNESLNNHNQQP